MVAQKSTFFFSICMLLCASLAFAGNNKTGNGAPSGSHYNLNIIGVEKAKTAEMKGSKGHSLFVSLGKNNRVGTKIYLQEGPFQVIDRNGTDGRAVFQLPQNDVDCPVDPADPEFETCDEYGSSSYSVFIRALGRPGGSADMTTCREVDGDVTDFECSTESVTLERRKGKSTFENVTRELTTLCVDTLIDGVLDGFCDERIQLFTDEQYLYFWDYDNFGLRLAQARFYPRP